ncbi:MAG: hypothetical protein CMD23_04320 [Flavobacteriales bacterium]|nr:hypothetical protein [Flavobacteriales bacterium]
MKKSNELLIGLFTCILLTVLYWGINFLKGENIFSNKKFFYSIYENVDGLTISRPVTMNGFRVGQVSNITFNSTKSGNLIVEVAIEEDIEFSNNSILEIYDSDLMGSKSLELKVLDGQQMAVSGDTLLGSRASGLTNEVTEQFGSMKVGLDQLIISFDKVLKEINELSNTANRILSQNEERVAHSVQNIAAVSELVDSHVKTIDGILVNISKISNEAAGIEFKSLSDNILSVSEQLDVLLKNMNSEQGSFGKFIYNDSIFNELANTLNSFDDLLVDIKENPKKYVNISLWGGDKKSNK